MSKSVARVFAGRKYFESLRVGTVSVDVGECIAPGIRDSASLQAGAVGSGGFRSDGARGTQLALLRGVERVCSAALSVAVVPPPE